MAAILIVEDDLTFATMLKTWLGKQGFKSVRPETYPKHTSYWNISRMTSSCRT